MADKAIPLYPHGRNSGRRAFYQSFGIEDMKVSYEAEVSTDSKNLSKGCNVARLSVSIHCEGPHLEVVSHILKDVYPAKVSDALEAGSVERAVMISPLVETLEDSGESYPVGSPSDWVISRRQLKSCLEKHVHQRHESVIIRIGSSYLPCYPDSNEIESWPYLTIEAAEYLADTFIHVRTNAPSLERVDSMGGMWAHSIFFGADRDRRLATVKATYPRRTVGELFVIPDELSDGRYRLLCPFLESGLDCAICLPLILGVDHS
jgi:kynurenine formamidase